MKKEYATYMRPKHVLEQGKWRKEIVPQQVRVMARAEGYAMVRLTGMAPFCVSEKELVSEQS